MVNRTYADLARHYGTAISPARPHHPKDKSKVEVGVQIVGRWILARLRNRRFFSLAALNEAIRGLLVDLNDRPLRGWGRSRRQLFDEVDRPALLPLPDEPYEYAEWKRCRGQSRLSCRDREALLQRPAQSRPPGGRRADHRTHRRDFPARQARGVASAQHSAASPDHGRRAYAKLASALPRLDP
jgi:hypothetical protein